MFGSMWPRRDRAGQDATTPQPGSTDVRASGAASETFVNYERARVQILGS